MLNTESVPSRISYKSFKTLPKKNPYCDHRNFDSVNQPLSHKTYPVNAHIRKPSPEYGSRHRQISLDGYSSHDNLIDLHNAVTAAWDICERSIETLN